MSFDGTWDRPGRTFLQLGQYAMQSYRGADAGVSVCAFMGFVQTLPRAAVEGGRELTPPDTGIPLLPLAWSPGASLQQCLTPRH